MVRSLSRKDGMEEMQHVKIEAVRRAAVKLVARHEQEKLRAALADHLRSVAELKRKAKADREG